ncbi:MAG: hypothetical protein A3K10_07495 [Bacteroidetes bacterium RIFCSPLOWO2_12_FULL_31_6]|nr:MAG: hypothetical protein A3K10_07495 [Bacteroidetes bacterium RIFCSPLOWO2_12_FULL_31_6]
MKTISKNITGNKLLMKIKSLVKTLTPDATLILYGSYARGDNRPDSDIDLLILLNKQKITMNEEHIIKYPLYDLAIETGQIISALVLPKDKWEQKHSITPFYENIQNEGIIL